MELPHTIARGAILAEPTARATGSALLDRRRVPRLLMSLALASTLLAGAAFALSRARGGPPPLTKKKTTVVVALTEPPPPKPPSPAPTAEAPEAQPDRAPPPPRPASRTDQRASSSVSPVAGNRPGAGEGPGAPDGTDPYADGVGPAQPGPAYAPPNVTAPPPPVAPPPPPPPKAKEPVRITEDIEPPVPLSMSPPGYPPAAKSAGVEGTVVIQYVVTESGAVTQVQAVKGPPELTAACLAAVSSWKFKPALSKGAPVSVVRQARFPFRIKT
ncbi:MAG: energy transducer TonB [Polyangiaceae bacterium]